MMHPELLLSLQQQHIQEHIQQLTLTRLAPTRQHRGARTRHHFKHFLHAAFHRHVPWAHEQDLATNTRPWGSHVCCPNI